jgi:hypothetical protein
MCRMKVSLLSFLTVLAIAVGLSSCTATGTKFAKLNQAKYHADLKKGSGGPKTVRVARVYKADPAQVQVAVERITSYIDSLSPEDKEVIKRHRYVCVCTTQAPNSKGKVTCMAWDSRSQSFVGTNAYELVNPPPVPSTINFDSFDAIFVGTAKIGPG